MRRSSALLIPLLSLYGITGLSEREARADEPPCPSQEPILHGPPGKSLRESMLKGGNVEIEADQALASLLDQTAILKGDVDILQGAREVKGEELEYNFKTNAVKSDRRITYQDPLVSLAGSQGRYSPSQGGDFKSAQFSLVQHSAHGTARSMHWSPQGVLTMQGVTFSTCPVGHESWSLKTRRLVLDTDSKVGSAHGAVVDFEGVPIVWLPALSFPLSNERKSGFLAPTFSQTSQSGFQVTAPIYLNLAPNADFTFEPTEYSLRNEDLAGDFRYLTPSSHGEIAWNYLPNDILYQSDFDRGSTRSHERFTDITELPAGFRLSLQGENVSDSEYFQNFSQGPEGTATAFLDRAADLSYRDEHWRFDGEAEEYQTIDTSLLPNERPYERLPRVGLSGDFSAGPFRYGFDSEAVRFDRNVSQLAAFPAAPDPSSLSECALTVVGCTVTGWRFNVTPRISLDLDGPGYFIRPAGGYSATDYQLRDVGGLAPQDTSRPRVRVPYGSFDTGLIFEKNGARHTLTLEPRVMYLYVPYRDQSQLPLFDTEVPDLNPIELFRVNRFVGGDRFGDANQVTAALSSRLLDRASGQQFLSATVGEAFYLQPPRVLLPGEVPQDQRSDFVAQLELTALEGWSTGYGIQWNPDTDAAVREYINLQYRPSPTSVVNLMWRFEQNAVDQGELSTAWPVTHSWSIFLREIYSLRTEDYYVNPASPASPDVTVPPLTAPGSQTTLIPVSIPPKPLETFAGFEYRSCCWLVRIAGRKFVSAFNGSQSYGAFFQVQLMGFPSVGDSDTGLMDNIRGYVPPNARVPQNYVPPAFP